MKKSTQVLLVLLLLLGSGLIVTPAWAQVTELIEILLARPTGGGLVSTGDEYQLAGAVGQADAGRLSGPSYRLNGGVMGEMLPIFTGPRHFYLPITLRSPSYVIAYEIEPNDYYSQASVLDIMPVRVFGAHDGGAGTGDVYQIPFVTGGQTVQVNLFDNDVNGVQLLAYNSAGDELVRDFDSPFSLSFTAT
ncbi:MAG TPA: hypothetical protein PKG95_14995, partial [Anaerolineaceae bacterium]|nr:hypothetical protein [Anaerolineaceae bacterium]